MSQITTKFTLPVSVPTTFHTDAGDAIPALNAITIAGGTNLNTSGAGSTATVNLDDTITLTRVNATTFDTNVAAAGVTLSGTTLAADGTNAHIDIALTPKGEGVVSVSTNISMLGDGAYRTLGHLNFLDNGVILLDSGIYGKSLKIEVFEPSGPCDEVMFAAGLTGAGVLYADLWVSTTIGAAYIYRAGGTDVSVPDGGTGASTLTSHGVLLGNGTSAVQATAEGATGSCLMGTTGSNPSFTGSPSFSGSVTAGTSLTASNGNVVVTSGNLTLPDTTSTTGQIIFNGNRYIHNYGNSTNHRNIFVGYNCGNLTMTNDTAKENTGLGAENLDALTTGAYNCSFGSLSLANLTSGSQNFSGGASCAYALTEGIANTILSYGSALRLTTGSYNTILGVTYTGSFAGGNPIGSGYEYTGAETSNILIANTGVVGESNKIRIGTQGTGAGQQNACYIAGIYGVTPGGTKNIAIVDSNGQLGSISSIDSATYPTTLSINNQTDSYQLVAGDAGKFVRVSKASACTLTVPKDATVNFAVGTQILVQQVGAGTLTLTPEDGTITISSAGSLLALFAQYSVCSLVKVAANSWQAFGDLG